MNLQDNIRRILKEIEEDKIQIRLGRSAERHFGKVQNIIIMVDDQDITSEDDVHGLGKMNIVIKDNEIIVGDIFIPEKYRKQGIATIVYQKISDYFNLPIVNSKTKGFNQTIEGGHIWKKRERFEPKNLQESIIRIVKEESSVADKMKRQIHKMGLYQFMKLSALSWVHIVSIIGVDFLSHKMMAEFIPNAINDTVGGFHLTEIDEDPIPYSSNEDEERQINYLGLNRAIVDVWGGNNFEKNLGEFGVHYYNLPDDILKQVFDIVMTVYEENKHRF